jgi:hypothetical protein
MRNGILIFKFNFFPNVIMIHLNGVRLFGFGVAASGKTPAAQPASPFYLRSSARPLI